MIFKRVRMQSHVGNIVAEVVNSKYTLKIRQGIGMDCDGNSHQEALAEVTRMIVNGDIDKNDAIRICEQYMVIRENIIMNRGGMSRWVNKNGTEHIVNKPESNGFVSPHRVNVAPPGESTSGLVPAL
ncbi:MAG: hypothetical protein AB1461_15340 [Thermodesulfobacteriota bacterium]